MLLTKKTFHHWHDQLACRVQNHEFSKIDQAYEIRVLRDHTRELAEQVARLQEVQELLLARLDVKVVEKPAARVLRSRGVP